MGWLLIMALYLGAYDLLEHRAVPVAAGGKTFWATNWDQGYFSAEGSLSNEDASTPGDELVFGTTKIICVRDRLICSISTASVYHGFLSLDVSDFTDVVWTDRNITFEDKSSICAEQYYTVDRVAETFAYLSKRKAVIPDYALKSPLKPCQNIKEMHVSLKDGFPVYWKLIKTYENANGLYFHIVLVIANLLYATVVVLLWRRRKRLTPISNQI